MRLVSSNLGTITSSPHPLSRYCATLLLSWKCCLFFQYPSPILFSYGLILPHLVMRLLQALIPYAAPSQFTIQYECHSSSHHILYWDSGLLLVPLCEAARQPYEWIIQSLVILYLFVCCWYLNNPFTCWFSMYMYYSNIHQEKPDLLICINKLVSIMISRGLTYLGLLSRN